MHFGSFLQRFRMLSGPENDPVVVGATALVLLMVATYLLIKRGSVWHIVSGVVVGLAAVLYILAAADASVFSDISEAGILGSALRLLGLA